MHADDHEQEQYGAEDDEEHLGAAFRLSCGSIVGTLCNSTLSDLGRNKRRQRCGERVFGVPPVGAGRGRSPKTPGVVSAANGVGEWAGHGERARGREGGGSPWLCVVFLHQYVSYFKCKVVFYHY